MLAEQNKPLAVELFEQDGLLVVCLVGVLNEDNRLVESLTEAKDRTLIVNLSRVERINSCGVRDWMHWVMGLESRGNRLYLVQVSPPLIGQLNLVRNLCGNAVVLSFQAPYYCPNCKLESVETLFTRALVDLKASPTAFCQSCGEPLEFDALPGVYFAFVPGQAARSVPDEITQNLAKFDDTVLATHIAALKGISSSDHTATPSSNKKRFEK